MSQIQSDYSGNPPTVIIKSLCVLLRPLVRFMLKNKITYTYLIGLLKIIFVEIAQEKEFSIKRKRTSDSRITLLTGVHRKDVRRLRKEKSNIDEPPKSITLGGQVVAHWCNTDAYIDTKGNPKPLPRKKQKNGVASFESLVTCISKDIRASVILEEWLKLGVATVCKKSIVTLNTAAFIPQKGLAEKAYYMGQNLRDHIAACANNLEGKSKAMMERRVYYTHLSTENVIELSQLAEEIGMKNLKILNARALKLRRLSKGIPNATERINFGTYFFYTNNNSH